jgi:hypothetical protein
MCFDFRAPVVTRLVRQITSRSPGRLAMYTPKEARVKVLTYPLSMGLTGKFIRFARRSFSQSSSRRGNAVQAAGHNINARRV